MAFRHFRPTIKLDKMKDGPLVRHPDEICTRHDNVGHITSADISKEEHKIALERGRPKRADQKSVEIVDIFVLPKAIDMTRLIARCSEDDISHAIEQWYVHTQLYLQPRMLVPSGMVNHYKREWDLNATGIYYRHYYSPHWSKQWGGKLWIPSLRGLDYNDETEESRRQRARLLSRHSLDNEKWNKSEYAWDADAWSDVFGQMRNDPVLAVDKHDYNASRDQNHPISCLLMGKPKDIYCKPDATFGLATFMPQDYQNALASYELDRERLQALMLNPNCGLVSDPKYGETDLVFPFAVYEAKGWRGDARVARHQACLAAARYLDMLDTLSQFPNVYSRLPGLLNMPEFASKPPIYLSSGPKGQVFVLTSFGAYWHILVGYKRDRAKEEFAGTPGVSDKVYIFQRLWSGRVVTDQKAWELLSLIDQIHIWGATKHRNYVIRLLSEWHSYCSKSYTKLANTLKSLPGIYRGLDGGIHWQIPVYKLPAWAKTLSPVRREKLQLQANICLVKAYISEFRPHPAGHIQGLFSIIAMFERYGEDPSKCFPYEEAEAKKGEHVSMEPVTLKLRQGTTAFPSKSPDPVLTLPFMRLKRNRTHAEDEDKNEKKHKSG